VKIHLHVLILVAAMTIGTSLADAGPLRERLRERMLQQDENTGELDTESLAALGGQGDTLSCAAWSQKVKRVQRFANGSNAGPAPDLRDVAYGDEPLQKLDVFYAKQTGIHPAPIILMVHGGGWCIGDKGGPSVTANKVARWVRKGFVFVSVNYPMVGEGSNALAQANHIAKAAAFVQANAGKWGGDPGRLILMGHSAGAHLVSLVNADAAIREANGVRPVLGTVSLDAGAVDVVKQMPNVYPFLKLRYREAFGDREQEWIAASPYHQLDRTASPWLGVCSTQRKDDPCSQARAYADKSNGLGIRAAVLPEPKSHGAINKELGTPGSYTDGVEAFMAMLDPVVAHLLKQ
jgi:acetyl esterase/lipase